jgi:phosphoribosylformimino-5-aminoimidazole carboxamide ribotide isomerase
MEAGVSRLILGTAAVTDPTFVKAAASRYPEQIAVGLDIRAGEIAVQGWSHNTGRGAVEVARQFEDAGVCALVVTDIGRDGMLSGVDVEVCGRVADSVDIPVIAAGGVTSADDITALRRRPGTPIAGAVLGKALYAGTLTPDAALVAAYGRTAC